MADESHARYNIVV